MNDLDELNEQYDEWRRERPDGDWKGGVDQRGNIILPSGYVWLSPAHLRPGRKPSRAAPWLTRIFVRWADEERALSLELRGLASWGGYAVG